jgi:diguanylate cyclase (GGDEF)-like protein
LAKIEPDLYSDLADTTHDPLVARERQRLDVDHAAAGSELLASWNLPDHIVTAVRNSHTPATDRSAPLDAIVAVSGRIADAIESQIDMVDIARQVSALGITTDQLNSTLEAIAAALPPLTTLLNASTPPEGRLAEMAAEMIMERMMSAQAATQELRDQAADAAETANRVTEEHRHDALTGQLTRRSLETAVDEHVEQWNQFGWPLAVMFVDVDHFKQVNDTYGHATGDQVLAHVARLLAQQLRHGDLIGRYGGDEFVIALPAVNTTTISSVAARLVAAVRSHPITVPTGDQHHQTISVGVATTDRHPAPISRQTLLEAADTALYQAKHRGRNQWAAE